LRRTSVLALSLFALAILSVGCGAGGATPTAVPSPTATATPTITSPKPSPEPASSTAELVERLRPSVVHILSEAATLDVFGQLVPSQGVGTGFVIDEKGHIVTNNHVVVQPNTCDQPARTITITLSDGRKFPARIVGQDVPTDLAVLQIDASNLIPVVPGDAMAVQVGEDVVAIGNALNLPGGPTVTKGVVSAKDRLIEEEECGVTIPGAIQTDASINPGNSGGPLVSTKGEVIGITTAIIGGAEGIGFAISIDTARPIVQELIEKGRIERGFLGVTIVPITPSLAESFNLPVDHGVGLRAVQRGSPADQAGLEPGDIIVKIADIEIQTSGDLFRALTVYRAGDRVQVEYYRGNDRNTAEVTIG